MKERELPLTALRAFAIAAVSPNLATAAAQLGVTHGAISKQIIALEAWLGHSLFTRQGRSLRLTPYGQILADQVADFDAASQRRLRVCSPRSRQESDFGRGSQYDGHVFPPPAY